VRMFLHFLVFLIIDIDSNIIVFFHHIDIYRALIHSVSVGFCRLPCTPIIFFRPERVNPRAEGGCGEAGGGAIAVYFLAIAIFFAPKLPIISIFFLVFRFRRFVLEKVAFFVWNDFVYTRVLVPPNLYIHTYDFFFAKLWSWARVCGQSVPVRQCDACHVPCAACHCHCALQYMAYGIAI